MHAIPSKTGRFWSTGGALSAALLAMICCPGSAKADERLDADDLPRTVQKTVDREAGDGRVIEIELLKGDGQMTYDVDVQIDGRTYELLIAPNGTLQAKQLDDEDDNEELGDDDEDEAGDDEGEDEGDSNEVRLRLADLPKSVAKTLKREARGGEIEEIEREIEDGRITYEAEVEFDDERGERVYEVEIDERGVLLSKTLQQDDDGDDDNDDREGDDE